MCGLRDGWVNVVVKWVCMCLWHVCMCIPVSADC